MSDELIVEDYDDSLLNLTADNKQLAIKNISDLIGVLDWVRSGIKDNSATIGQRESALSLTRSHVKDLHKIVGGEEYVNKEVERSNALCRAAHQKLHDLRKEMGDTTPLSGVVSKVYELKNKIDGWWEDLGFSSGRVPRILSWQSSMIFECELVCRIKEYISSYSTTPVADQEKLDKRKVELEKLLEVYIDPQDKTSTHILDSEKNRAFFQNVLTTRFPKSYIKSFKNMSYQGKPIIILSEIQASIYAEDI